MKKFENVALVVTSIMEPTAAIKALAAGARDREYRFIVIGDRKSPATYDVQGVEFFSVEKQEALRLSYVNLCPFNHYVRKNIGYLVAIEKGARTIVETDDDNLPYESFWSWPDCKFDCRLLQGPQYLNAYSYFTSRRIWPRGFPLDRIGVAGESKEIRSAVIAPIQQGLADANPDVDAIYRLTAELPINFEKGDPIALDRGVWCPFNSQNTIWSREAFMLLYLPAFCSFRMTDIWRSFVAQRICWENDWKLVFREATVWQDRNDHNLMKDFDQELVGYLRNRELCETLEALDLAPGPENIADNLIRCYQSLVKIGIFPEKEIDLLKAWIADFQLVSKGKLSAV